MDAPNAQSAKISSIWPPPCVVSSVAGRIRIPNLTDQPQTLKRNEHFCQVSPVFAPGDSKQTPTTPPRPLKSHTSPKPFTHSCGVSLVTAFAEVGRYSKPQPSLMPDVDSTLRLIGQWKHIIATDLTSAFYQIPLARESLKYCGVATPFPNAQSAKISSIWPPPCVVSSVAGRIRIPNLTDQPQTLKRNEHFCQVSPVFAPGDSKQTPTTPPRPLKSHTSPKPFTHSCGVSLVTAFAEVGRYSKPQPSLMPDVDSTLRLIGQWKHIIATDLTSAFYQIPLARESLKYCGVATPFPNAQSANISSIWPPPCVVSSVAGRIRIPNLTDQPQTLKRNEHFCQVSPFFSPGDSKQTPTTPPRPLKSHTSPKPFTHSCGVSLVTAFAEVGRYSKPQPSLMPDVDSTLRLIGQWKHIIATDLTSAFYQIPLARESLKYCGVATPFRGTRVYVRSAMGMPGSETALEELMCRVLGDLLQEGVVAKLADDLYCGGNSPEELLHNWTKVLSALHKNNLRLSAAKTVVNPKTTTILGWTWSQGTLSANPHRISTLVACSPPEKVGGMKSFIGAYKVLARVIPGCSSLLAPLDDAIAGRPSTETIAWTDGLHDAFSSAKKALSTSRFIHLPKPDDHRCGEKARDSRNLVHHPRWKIIPCRIFQCQVAKPPNLMAPMRSRSFSHRHVNEALQSLHRAVVQKGLHPYGQ